MTAALAASFLAYTVASSLSIYPHSLSYFNELTAVFPTPADASYPKPRDHTGEHAGFRSSLKDALAAGPRNGPRHLLDSNIDWGQDLFYLEDWYESHPEARPIRVAYSGALPLEKSKIESAGVPPIGPDREHIDSQTDATAFGPLPGWYALSVNEIYSQSQEYRYFLHFRPEAMAGYSIYIYHITLDEANRVRRELGLKELAYSDSKEKGAGRRIVDVQELDGDHPRLCLAHQSGLVPAKMTGPVLLSRIVQRVNFPVQHSGKVGAFGPITFRTGVAEGFRIVASPVLLGNDMLNVECQEVGVAFHGGGSTHSDGLRSRTKVRSVASIIRSRYRPGVGGPLT